VPRTSSPLLLDGHLVCRKLVDCRGDLQWDCRGSTVGVAKGAACGEGSSLHHSGCIVGSVSVLTIFLLRQHVEHVVVTLGVSLLSSRHTKGQGLEASSVRLMDKR
jgi:hypothetical protein